MLARLSRELPVDGYLYEPRRDGFRWLVDRPLPRSLLLGPYDEDGRRPVAPLLRRSVVSCVTLSVSTDDVFAHGSVLRGSSASAMGAFRPTCAENATGRVGCSRLARARLPFQNLEHQRAVSVRHAEQVVDTPRQVMRFNDAPAKGERPALMHLFCCHRSALEAERFSPDPRSATDVSTCHRLPPGTSGDWASTCSRGKRPHGRGDRLGSRVLSDGRFTKRQHARLDIRRQLAAVAV